MFQNKLGECPYLYSGMIYALETKAASVVERMSTAIMVRNDIRSKYTEYVYAYTAIYHGYYEESC